MKERIRKILSNLKSVQEDLLALSDDLWLEIDHNDNETIQKGVYFKSEFNKCNSNFTDSANALSDLIQNYTNTPLYQQEKGEVKTQVRSESERIIKELSKKEPHNLTEDFKYKRPYGFVLQAVPYSNKLTWSEVYMQLCTHLQSLNPTLFHSLENNPDHISNRKNKYFSSQLTDLRSPQKCGPLTYVEMNLSANQIRDSIKRLLTTYTIGHSELTIYLREDRDA